MAQSLNQHIGMGCDVSRMERVFSTFFKYYLNLYQTGMARQDYPGNIKDNFRNRQYNLIALQGNIKSNKDRQEGRKGLKTGRQE